MADWTDLLQRPGQSNGLADFFLKSQNDASTRNTQAAQLQVFNAQAQAAQAKATRDQQFQTDWASYIADPKPNTLLNLQGKYPDKAEAISGIWKAKDAAAKTADQGYMGSVYSALQNKRTDLALQLMRQRRDADAAAGLDTADDDAQIAAISDGKDPSAVNTVKGMFLAHLAAIDPDKFASTYGAVTKPEELKNVGPGSSLVDPVTGKVTFQAPFTPQYRNVGQGDTLVEVGGGGQASGGAGSGQRTQFGWTPRQRNGGDNSDAAVDSKLAGMSSALGIDTDAPFPPGTSNMQVFKALTLSEGGAGTLADRNNNPGNLTDAKTGKLRVFPTKEAGIAAGAAQVARNRNRGQNSIRTMVEGLPAGGTAAQGGGGATVVATGATKPGYRMLTPDENQAQGLDPNVKYQVAPDGQITALGGQSKAQLKPIPTGAVKEIIENRKSVRQIDTAMSELNNYQGAVGPGTGFFGNWFSQLHDPKGNAARAAIANIGSLIIHDRSGSAVTVSETPRLQPFIPQVSDPAAVVKTKLGQLRSALAEMNSDYESQYSEDQGFKPFKGASVAGASTSAPVTVRSIQQAQALAPGTVYRAPDGKLRRR